MRFLLAGRRLGIRGIARYYRNRHPGKAKRARSYLEEDQFRLEGGFKALGVRR